MDESKLAFFCGEHMCLHCTATGFCKRPNGITTNERAQATEMLSEGLYPLCFDSITDHEDYNATYWKLGKDEQGRYRFKAKGKKLTISGITVYTNERIYKSDEMDEDYLKKLTVTEEKTGLKLRLYDLYDLDIFMLVQGMIERTPNVLTIERIKD